MAQIHTLSPHEAAQKIAKNAIAIIDIRDARSYQTGHIANAEHLLFKDFPAFIEKISKLQAVLIYCYHGISSQAAAQYLSEQGFQEVYSLQGGFEAWQSSFSK
jgi:thiosulfate sulfurtransferase